MIPSDCLVVDLKKDVKPFTSYTWNAHKCPKTIPLDLYNINKDRLIVVDDPHNLVSEEKAPEPEEETPVDNTFEAPEIKDPKKVNKVGKGKNRKR